MNIKKKAFTLAEVLAAMTIVGVVAAMTIPTLNYGRVQKEYSAKLKNFYSKMNNAILDMELDHGSFRDMTKATDDPAGTEDRKTANEKDPSRGLNWYKENLDPYIGHESIDETKRTVYFKDGSSLNFLHLGACMDVIYDTNGDKAPNSLGRDQYRYLFCFTNGDRRSWFGDENTFFGTYGQHLVGSGITRDTMLQTCKTDASKCSRLLQNDQWEYKKDYPYKF